MDKAKQLYFLLEKKDRNKIEVFQSLEEDKEKFPFFFLLNWNEELSEVKQRKVALQSLFRNNYKFSIDGACKIQLVSKAKELAIEEVVLSQDLIINQFLELSPGISKLKRAEITENYDEIDYSKQTFDFPISETFAKILMKQGKHLMAKEVFEQLSLKFPEKKTYFATLLNELNLKINNT